MAIELSNVRTVPLERPSLTVRSGDFLSRVPLNGSPKVALVPHSENPAQENSTFDESGGLGELLSFEERNSVDLEFSSQSHLIILLPDGIPGGCEWSNGSRGGKLTTVLPNTIIFNPAREYLSIKKKVSQRHCRVRLLSIVPALASRIDLGDASLACLQFHQQIGVEDQGVLQALVAIHEEIEAPGLNSRTYLENWLMLLLTRLMRCASNFATPCRPIYVKGGLPSWRLKRALDLLGADLTKTPSLAELAEPLKLHPTSFCRAFKQSTGLSPHRYLLEKRIARAKELMRDEKRKLTEIALDCGFHSSSQFSVVFRRLTGVAPRIYRQSL